MSAILLGIALFLTSVSLTPAYAGSCQGNGITVCCTPDNCPQQISPDGCYCDTTCHQHGDCCDDIDEVCPTESCTDGAVRLSGSSNSQEGRVEVCLDGKWGTVCHQNWSNADARVVCRQLNQSYTGAAGVRNARFSQGDGPIHMSSVNCYGNESSIFDCNFENNTIGCNHGMDSGVICSRASCVEGEVRLANGFFESQGRVEVCLGGTWGSVCDNAWDRLDAVVVCKQLNMSIDRVLSVGRAHFGSGKSAINMNDVQCKGTEGRLIDCKYNENSDCTHAEDAGVFCGIRLGCIDGTVRLANGSNATEGRVEICVGSSWRTVCDDGWDRYAASVVCRQLGYPSAGAVAFNGSMFGPGDSNYEILYTQVTCTGHETNLRGCGFMTPNSSDSKCSHARDAGVRCLRGPGECKAGSVRLVEGADEYEGRIEVCLFERWGTVCDHSWSTAHAEVVCRQLGLPTLGATAYSGAYFGIGKGPIHIDDAVCTGDETNITQCTFTSNDNCLHLNDAGVRCSCVHGDVRLVDGATDMEGRVEICMNGVWGTVTDDGWDSFDSNVVCRQLGYMGNVSFPKLYAAYGRGSGPIHMTVISCTGSESRLIDCRFSPNTRGDSHVEDAGVACYNGTTTDSSVCETGDIRLAGLFSNDGRVEVCSNGVWGSVCYALWDSFDSAVVCSTLGYAKIGDSYFAGFTRRPGPGRGPVLMSVVNCLRTSNSLFDCYYTGPLIGCSHFGDVGVRCFNKGTCMPGDVRLLSGTSLSNGRVEVCYDSVWGTVSSNAWSDTDAKVVCKQLGYFPHLALPRLNGYYGRGRFNQPIPLHSVGCSGREDSLLDCRFQPRPLVGVTHSNDAGVDCFTTNGTISSPNCTAGSLRLVGGANDMEGRVEVCLNGEWGTICDDLFGSSTANVICNQLGFSRFGAVALPTSHYGEGNGSIFIDDLSCTGHEKNWWECSSYTANHNCRHFEDASVRCQPKACKHGEVRLADGANELEGRLEVCIDGAWGTVCHDFWTGIDAQVVCRQLGYLGTFALGYNSAFFGQGTGPIVMDDIRCIGNEIRLIDCPFDVHTADCIHLFDVGVKCYPDEGSATNTSVCKLGDTRLVNGSKPNEGRVEVCIDNVWGTVCDDRFQPPDAVIVCRQLGYSDLGATPVPGAAFGRGTGPIYMDNTYCFGDEDWLLDCAFDPHTADCHHGRDVGVICSIQDECDSGDIRLVNGSIPTEGRIEICVDGVWGTITSVNFDHREAKVACAQLGYDNRYAVTYGFSTLSYFGDGMGPVHMHNLACVGNEPSLLNCTYDKLHPLIINPHIADAGVRCFNTSIPACTPGAIRLVNGSSPAEGRVEMCMDNVWGTVCGIIWLEIDSLVVCRQLGYNDYAALTLPWGSYGLGVNASNASSVPIYLTPLCNGTEQRLMDCEHYQITACNHGQDTALRCFNSESCTEGALRLVNGSSMYEGRVEICQHSVWGTICDDLISRIDARVACRNLGLSERYAVSFVGGYFGAGTGPIHMDDVQCLGTETKLRDCEHDSLTDDCRHNEDAGIACYNQSQCTTGDVRLVNGNNTYEGRLEFCSAGIWGTVCSFGFGLAEAIVVCTQLNLTSTYAVPYINGYYGRGSSEIVASSISCLGNEQRLTSCLYSVTAASSCSHFQDVGVACYPTARCNTTGQTRLVNGQDEYEGRVEICLNGVWGTVEDDFFGVEEAAVVCRSLGYPTIGAEPLLRAFFGPGNGRLQMNFLRCTGNESNLTACPYNNVLATAHHFEDAGVRCYSGGQCTPGSIRLSDGASDMEGRVEVCSQSAWGTVSRFGWNSLTARVACGQLGYSDKIGFVIPVQPGVGPVAINSINCDGDEPSIFNCTYTNNPRAVFHQFDVGIKCYNISVPGQCINGAIRLRGGYTTMEGRVEVCADGIWQMVCHSDWSQADGNVVCRQLGYGVFGSQLRFASFYGHNDNGFLFGNARCTGFEDKLVDCSVNVNTQCTVLQSAGIQCSNRSCDDGDVRLVDGPNPNEGRVEVCIGGVWGTVCSRLWETTDARVVCGQLGYSNFTAVAVYNAYYGLGSAPILMNSLQCTGNEDKLINCDYSNSIFNCNHGLDAGVKCFNSTSDGVCDLGDVRLVGGAYNREGRVEVCFNGQWGTVCDENWDVLDATITCRQLGYQPIGRAFTSSFFPPGNGSIFMNKMSCFGNEGYLAHCPYQDNIADCSHASEAGARCYLPDNCINGQIRLFSNRFVNYSVDGRIGRLEYCYEGVWSSISGYIWNSIQSRIACNELGLGDTLSPTAVENINFGPVHGPNVYVLCRRRSSSLSNCIIGPADLVSPFYRAPTPYVYLFCPQPPCNDGDIRLVNGSGPHQGRIEICLNNTWGTISDDRWSYADGQVACRQLGYSDRVLTVRIRAYYGEGKGPIFFRNFFCRGTEQRLISCSSSTETSFETHSEDAGLDCYPNNECNHGEIRLVNGTNKYDGRLEVCNDGVWGTVTSDGWSFFDSRVVCAQLGFSRRYALHYDSSVFGSNYNIPIVMDSVFCRGTENYLVNCSYRSRPSASDTHAEDVGIQCYGEEVGNCSTGDVRLFNGSDKYEGTVQICIGGVWGTVCDRFWSESDGRVVCRQLGYSTAGVTVYGSSYYGNAGGPIYLNRMLCSGSEDNLLLCYHSPYTEFCTHEMDAGVKCHPGSNCTNGDVRLAGSSLEYEGRVEVCVDGVWGTICNNLWDQKDATVVCRQLGLPYQFPVPLREGYFGVTNAPILLNNLRCTGNEANISECSSTRSFFCTRSQDIGVACLSEGMCNHGDMRLVNGTGLVSNNNTSGTLEICINGVWGTVCDDNWNIDDAKVACNALGLPSTYVKPYHNAHFGEGEGPIFLSGLRCLGNERNLTTCPHSLETRCAHKEDAGVQCLEKAECSPEGTIKLVNGSLPSEGRLEVCIRGVWGTVSDDRWDSISASTVCKILGFSSQGVVYYRAATYGQGVGPVHLDNVFCYGEEKSILECSYDYNNGFETHIEDVGIKCLVGGTCNHGEVKLVDGSDPSEGRIEICVDGIWGTVGSFRLQVNIAKVVCRQLGYSDQVSLLYYDAYFGPGTGAVALAYTFCDGDEANLTECFSWKFPPIYRHSEDAGVKCYNTSELTSGPCTLGDVRLYGGPNNRSGVVEVCLNGQWGAMCNRFLDDEVADVVCGQLGFASKGSTAVFATAANFSNSTGIVWLKDVLCYNSPNSLLNCSSYNPDTSTCTSGQTIGVNCSLIECSQGDVRLVDGEAPYEGRVEVCVGGKWGTVCDNSWDHRDAQVICRQLGYSGNYASPYHANVYPGGTIPTFIDSMYCTGNETGWSQCEYSTTFAFVCRRDDDVGVRCYNDSVSTDCETGRARLVNGTGNYDGRVEVCIYGTWSSVCDNYWEVRDATVICNQLGYNSTGVAIAYKESYYGPGSGETLLRSLACRGTESSLLDCFHTATIGSCDHSRDSGVRCKAGVECNATGAVRLVDGASQLDGRVEMCYKGLWHTIPRSYSWSRSNARLVCRQLGQSSLIADVITPVPGKGPIYSSVFYCTRDDYYLFNCNHGNSTYGSYDHTDDVGIRCYANVSINCTYGSVRLVNGSTEREGRPEVCWNGIDWIPVSSTWSTNNQRIICNYLGYGAIGVNISEGTFGNKSSNLSLNVNCYGRTSVYECDYSLVRNARPVQYNTAIHCPVPMTNCTDGDIRLTGGETELEGRLEICYGKAWGTINDYGVLPLESAVVCRQLGFSDQGSRIFTNNLFRSGPSLPIAFDYFICSGNEKKVWDCSLRYYGYISSIASPVGVRCQPIGVNSTSLPVPSSTSPSLMSTTTMTSRRTSIDMSTTEIPTPSKIMSSRPATPSKIMSTRPVPSRASSPIQQSSSVALSTAKSEYVSSTSLVEPTNVREASLTATISGGRITAENLDREAFKTAVARSLNSYCARQGCSSRKRDSDHEFHNIDSNSVYIVSVTDVGDGRLRIEFYVMVRSGVAYDTDTLENAVKDGIQSGIFRDAGFHSMTVQKTTTTTGATPGNASKSSGLSAGASAGLALGIIILVALICVAVAVLVIIWLKYKTRTYDKEGLVVRSESGFLSNRSSCVEMDVPGYNKDQPSSDKGYEKMQEAMSENTGGDSENNGGEMKGQEEITEVTAETAEL